MSNNDSVKEIPCHLEAPGHETLVSGGEGSVNYEVAELKPRFSVISAIGIQYSISATPLAVGGYLTFILGVGGSPFFFYGFIVAAVGQILICVSLAEIAAVYPHASGNEPLGGAR